MPGLSKALRDRFSSLKRRGGYARDTVVNTGGLLAAAALPILSLPILSRLYSPEHFGIYGVFAAMVGLGTIASTGRYEAAIMLPADDQKAVAVAGAGAIFTIVVALLLALAAIVAFISGVELVRLHTGLVALAVVTVWLAGSVQILLNAAIRRRQFATTSAARVAGAVTTAGLSILLGFFGELELGLSLGMAGGYVSSILALVLLLRRHYGHVRRITTSEILAEARRYRHFPTYSLPSDFANTLASNLPVLFFSSFFGPTAAGYLTMFQRIWGGSAILVQGLGETFRQRAAAELQETGRFVRTMRVTVVPLAVMASAFFVVLVALGPFLFSVVVGEQWREAGAYGQILAPLVCLQFVASPISWAFYLSERLKLLMAWQWTLLAVFSLVCFVGTRYLDERSTLALLSAAGGMIYLVYAALSVRLAGVKAR